MQVLLINQNATIERLVKLSSGKLGYELTNAKDISEVENGAYGFIIIDSDLYNEEEFGVLKQKFNTAKYILIITKGAEKPEGFDIYVEKPFLPTELVDIFSSLASSIPNSDEDAVFGDDISPFGNDEESESEFGAFDEDAVFKNDEPKQDSSELGELDDFGALELDDEKPAEAVDELGDLEFSFDEVDSMENNEEEASHSAIENDALDEDDFQINLDEQIGAIGDEIEDIDFDAPKETALENSIDEMSGLDSIESNDEFASLDELDAGSLSLDDMSPENENIDNTATVAATVEEEDDFGNLSFDEEDAFLDDTPSQESDPHIFDEDEVNKLKDLLDETEEDKLENDDFDLDNIKIHNEELGSLTEESLAEALGVNIDDSKPDIDNSAELEGDSMDDALPDILPAVTPDVAATAATNIPANAIQLNPNQSITISLDALKELLNMADVTINITLSKKQ